MAENKNLLALSRLYSVYNQMLKNLKGEVDVFVTSAVPLDEKQKNDISVLLKKRLDKKINLICKVNSSIIGGLLINYNCFLIDSTIKRKLFKMNQLLHS